MDRWWILDISGAEVRVIRSDFQDFQSDYIFEKKLQEKTQENHYFPSNLG